MSQLQILPPLPIVEDSMDDLALTPYNCPQYAFNFEEWQEQPQRELPSLVPHLPPTAAAAPYIDSSPEAVIYRILLWFQL